METCFFLLRRHANVHMDISGIPPRLLLRYFPRLAEVAHKTLFGTDWPSPGVESPRKNLEELRALSLAPEAQQAILEGTAERIFARR
jgi:predicted TIM-barrel fold metal-dependent hydrolase